jgi:hypothetical protein
LAACFAACGGGGGGGGTFASIAAGIESPTGTVDETSAVDVAEEFEGASQSAELSPFGARDLATGASSQSGSFSCPAGGSISFSAQGNTGNGTAGYNNCCFEQSCCISGSARVLASSGSSAYTACIDANLSVSCEGQSGNVSYSGCINASGGIVVLIEVDGESFAVSGNYSGGSGTLEITGDNGTFTCTYSGGSGCCSGSGGASFTF